jgi:hypothetical protein
MRPGDLDVKLPCVVAGSDLVITDAIEGNFTLEVQMK